MLAGLDGGLEVRRAEAGRGGEDGVVHAGNGQRLLVGVKAAEAFVLGQLEGLPGLLRGFGEDVGDGDDLAFDAGALAASVKSRPAPLPRPPMPMMTALRGVLDCARTSAGAATTAATVASVEFLRNWRRERDCGFGSACIGSFKFCFCIKVRSKRCASIDVTRWLVIQPSTG